MLPPARAFMGVFEKPGAVVGLLDHVGGDNHPLAGIRGGGLLAVPNPRPRDVDRGIRKAIFINRQRFEAAQFGEAPDIGQ
jgi:hypothetical protein